MKSWLRHHFAALSRAARRLGRHPLSSLLTAIVIGVALALPAGGMTLLDNASRAIGDATGRPEISVFLELEARQAEVDKIAALLEQEQRVADFSFVSRDAALEQLAQSGLEDVIRDLPSNPLPHAFVVNPAGDEPALFEDLRTAFARWPAVDQVQLDSAWVDRLHAIIELGRKTVVLLAALLASALVIVTFNTIRLQLMTQRAEIEVSRLLGATDDFIRRPFLWLGALQGLFGGLVAWLLVEAMVVALRAPVDKLAHSYGTVFSLQQPQSLEVLALLSIATVLGLIGATLSVDRHLRSAA